MHRLPTVLHIPDIKPRYSNCRSYLCNKVCNNDNVCKFRTRRESGASIISSSSLIPSSNIKQMGSKLGKSLLNLASLITGSASDTFDTKSSSEPFKPFAPQPQPPRHRDTPTVPRRPARRKLSADKARHKSLSGLDQSIIGETIAEVESPLSSPTPQDREPRVKMPGDMPSVPMPGVPRIPSPTSTSEIDIEVNKRHNLTQFPLFSQHARADRLPQHAAQARGEAAQRGPEPRGHKEGVSLHHPV